MFWYLNKLTNAAEIFGSISAICENTELKPDTLYYHFSRMKRSEFENESVRIVKCQVKRSRAELR